MASLFISDLHLDDARPQATEAFLGFLRGPASRCEALYILGDLFEYWLGDDAPTPAGVAAARALAELRAAGVPLYFLHGNRDFLIGNRFAEQAGLQLLPEEQVLDLYGRPTLVLHGDTLCTDDVAYQQIRSMLRNPEWQRDFLSKTPDERVRMALEARELSADHKQGVSMEIMDVNQQAVRSAFERHQVLHMIHGHTHRPAVHQHATGHGQAERTVLGDWYDQGSVLEVDAAGSRMLPISI
jgi:UDP-2,3-diacylglucosamine hydrolase